MRKRTREYRKREEKRKKEKEIGREREREKVKEEITTVMASIQFKLKFHQSRERLMTRLDDLMMTASTLLQKGPKISKISKISYKSSNGPRSYRILSAALSAKLT